MPVKKKNGHGLSIIWATAKQVATKLDMNFGRSGVGVVAALRTADLLDPVLADDASAIRKARNIATAVVKLHNSSTARTAATKASKPSTRPKSSKYEDPKIAHMLSFRPQPKVTLHERLSDVSIMVKAIQSIGDSNRARIAMQAATPIAMANNAW
jgi:hypothetical protein